MRKNMIGFLLMLSVLVMCETTTASGPACIQSEEMRDLSNLVVTTCLEVFSDKSDDEIVTKYIRQTVNNISNKVIELTFYERPQLHLPILISVAWRNVAIPLPGVTEDDPNQEEFKQNHHLLPPGDSLVLRYKIEDLMSEVPITGEKYRIGIPYFMIYRFLDESREDAFTRRQLDREQHQKGPRNILFKDVRLQ